jgi:hypothetical protein
VRRLFANKYLVAVLVLVAVTAIFGLASSGHPSALASGARSQAPARAGVSSALRACPGPGSTGATASGLTLAAAASGTGQAAVTRLSPLGSTAAPAPLHVLTQPGRLSQVNVAAAPAVSRAQTRQASASASSSVPTSPGRGGVMIQATGAMARGLEAEQTSTGGLGGAQCLGPGTDFWFVGPGQKSAADISLYLMNTDAEAADATVQILTDSGPILGTTDAGIPVPPHGLVVQALGKLVGGSRVLALNVTTSVGRVVPAVRETTKGSEPGTWLPPALPPATSQMLPGLPGTPGGRNLYVAVPGATNAQIKVTAVTSRGSYQPTGGSGIDLPGGSAIEVSLPSMGGIPAAIQVTSNVPVTASMEASGGPSGAPGVFTAASSPVQEQGVVAGNPANSGGSTQLVLSAPQAAAQVRVTELTSAGQAGAAPRTVSVAGGHTVAITVPAPRTGGKSTAFSVIITPLSGSGPVYAGRVVSQNDTPLSLLPVTSALTWVPLPAVRSSVTTALP